MSGGRDPVPVITVDGPGGSGKGTLAGRLAELLGYHLLDSGALYRVVALAAARAGVDPDDGPAVARLARGLAVDFRPAPGGGPPRARLAGEDVEAAIRTEARGGDASRVAAHPEVRAALLERQRALRRPPGLVADGRDMGTVVFPDAPCKLFLTAAPPERARRRHKQLMEKGIGVSLQRLREEIETRDRRDRERAVAPLMPAPGAVVIDTTGLSIEAVLERARAAVAAAIGGGAGAKAP